MYAPLLQNHRQSRVGGGADHAGGGRFTDAHIELERAYAQIQGNGQENMALCCDFLARRLSLFTNVEQRCSLEERYAALLRHHDMAWINL